MKEPFAESLSRWSLDRLRFLLSHIEDFIDDEERELSEKARSFQPAGGLEHVQSLVQTDPNDPQLARRVLERLSAFFDAGLLIQSGPSSENAGWWVTDIFWRGSVFHLQPADQTQTDSLVPEMPPLQVHRANALKMLTRLKLQFLVPSAEADAYLLRPTPTLAFVLVSNLGAPWSQDHVAHAHRLVNKCFLY